MVTKAIDKLEYIINTIPNLLTRISEEEFSKKTLPNKWSKKEILGHLIDSATNNHQRFVRGQFEITPEIRYDQNKWNEYSFHQSITNNQLISFWTIYNKQLIEILKRIPNENLTKQVRVGENLLTLEFLVVDYVRHMEHHLKQIIEYY